ncbi:MAG: hypothetical protein V3T23_04985 [Nitrososphaerales archaeon]
MTTTLTATFPVVESFADYHYIDDFAHDLNKLFKAKIRCAEVGFSGHYWGVFYVGRKPNKAAIKELLDKAGFEPMYDDDE